MRHVKRTFTVENTWICDSCQAKNLGRHTACQSCANPKEKQERDTVPDPEKDRVVPVTDPELLRLANQGANWVCEFCGGQVRDEHGKCVKNCGAPRPEVKIETADGRVRISATGGAKVSNIRIDGETVVDADGRFTTPKRPPRGPPEPVSKPFWTRFPWAAWAVVVGTGVAGLVWLGVFLFASWEETTTVTGIQWNYKAELHQRTLMHGSGWGAPIGSFNSSCRSKHYGTEDCHPHDCNPHSESYECNCTSTECNCRTTCSDNGNGFSTCTESCSTCQSCSTCSRTVYDTCHDQCDVYKDWCEYDYYEWPIVATNTTGGTKHDEHWPDLAANGPTQRLDRTERYRVDFERAKSGEKKSWTLNPRALADFQRFHPGATWRIKVNRVGSVTPLQEQVQ